MTVTLRDARISASDQAWIRSVYRSYLSELSVGRSGLFPALGEWPAREEEFLAGWLQDPAAQPFVILLDGSQAGFALVVRPTAFPRRTVDYRMAEFYVTDSARRRGVGAAAAALLFARFSGEWEVLEDEHNRGALAFWRRVIGVATQGRYAESRVSGEVRHQFCTSARPAVRST